MSPPKETIMVLKVDLDCDRCYRKVKKLLCSIPQIKDQIYNEKQNTVMIKVVCCSPEKIRDKLCCKGRKSIRSIDIIEPKKPEPRPPPKPAVEPPPQKPPPPAEKPQKPPPPAEKPQKPPTPPAPKPPPPAPKPQPQEPAPKPPPQEPAPKPPPQQPAPQPRQDPPRPGPPAPAPEPIRHPVNVCCSDCYNGRNTGPCHYGGYGVPPPAPQPRQDPPRPGPPAPAPEPIRYPVNVCCSDCYNGRNTGPCHYGGYGVPPPPPPPAASSWCCDYPAGGYNYGYGYGNKYRPGYCVSRCGDYISEENPSACVIM